MATEQVGVQFSQCMEIVGGHVFFSMMSKRAIGRLYVDS